MSRLILIFGLSLFVAGCELVGDIFQAGLVVGIIIVVAVVAIVAWLWRAIRGRRAP